MVSGGSRSRRIALAVATVLALLGATAGSAGASTYVVNSNTDGSDATPGDDVCATVGAVCTLRAAIEEANAHANADTINFAIGSGPKTITPATPLPVIGSFSGSPNPVTIDATTQPGFTTAPIVSLSGVSTTGNGLSVLTTGLGSTIKGLIINGFSGSGIATSCSGSVTIQGNYIGTDAAGTASVANGSGIHVIAPAGGTCGSTGSSHTIGGPTASDRNVISGNTGPGIWLEDQSLGQVGLFNNTVRNNLIGWSADQSTHLGNGGSGVEISGGGGPNTITENLIAFNGGDGIEIDRAGGGPANAPLGNDITLNNIQSNSGLGIDLGGDGVTPNDAFDADTGANGLQNYPYVDTAVEWDGIAIEGEINGELFSEPSTSYRIDVYASNGSCDPSGFGEGIQYLGGITVTTDSAGHAFWNKQDHNFSATQSITATATPTSASPPPSGATGSTSEFSPCRAGTSFGGTPPPLRTLTVSRAGLGQGAVTGPGINCGPGVGQTDCSEDYGDGTPVHLLATPAGSDVFAGWSGDCAGTGACDVTTSPNRNVTATFNPPPKTLTVTAPANGTITATGVNCGSGVGENDCTETYAHGTVVTLSQTAKPGFAFANWSGDCSGAGACQVTMTADHAVGAAFAQVWTLTVGRAGGGTGTVTGPGISCGSGANETDCAETYVTGTSVLLTVTPSGGSSFAGWSGDCGDAGSCSLTMTANRSATATFNPPQQPAPPADSTPPDTVIDAAPKKSVKKTASFSFHSTEVGGSFECAVDDGGFTTCSSPFKTQKLKPGKHTFSVCARDAAGNVDQSPATSSFKVKKKRK
jgi:CSLREA domain-containing protein